MECVLAMILGEKVDTYTSLQRIHSIVFQLIGVSIVATVFGQFGTMMADFNARESQWQQLMMERCAMMRFMQIPEETQYRIRKYYEYQREQSEHGFISSDLTKEFVDSLSKPLKSEVLLFTHRQQLDNISIFKKCSHEAVQSVITNLQLEIFLPGDYVVTYGSIGDTFFLLTSGRCDILDRRGDQFDTLKAGQHFGEGALLDGNEYEATVRAKTYCNFNTLTRKKFHEILEEHPEYKNELIVSLESASKRRGSLLRRNRNGGENFKTDVLRKRSGIFSISSNDQMKFTGAGKDEVDKTKSNGSNSKVKVTPLNNNNSGGKHNYINEEEEDLSGIEDLEDLEAQRSRLIGGANDMPKPPLKKPGSTAMNQSKLKKASSSWE